MNRQDFEKYLGKSVEIKLFDGEVVKGYLQKTGEEKFKNDPNLFYKKGFYFVTGSEKSKICISCLFRVSHVGRIKEV